MNTKVDIGTIPVKEAQTRCNGGCNWGNFIFHIDQLRVDLDACSPRSLLSEAGDLKKTILARKASKYLDVQNYTALYVVGPMSGFPVKVGIAEDPITRLAGMQVGNHERLIAHAVFWTADAAYVEHAVQKAAKRIGIHEHGEWIAATPLTAVEMIMEAAKDLSVDLFTSGIYVENRGRMMIALEASKVEGRADMVERLQRQRA